MINTFIETKGVKSYDETSKEVREKIYEIILHFLVEHEVNGSRT